MLGNSTAAGQTATHHGIYGIR